MSNYIFNAAAAALTSATLDLSTGNYYAHLVTTTPLITASTVADLVLPTSSTYAATPLTGLSYTTQRWTFDSFNFPRYIFATLPPVGVVICKRAGALAAATDQVICYSDFNNSIGQVITLNIGAYVVNLAFGTGGAISFDYRYQYTSGAYVAGGNGGYPVGLIYLIGTNNNTVAFTNPVPTKIPVITNASASTVYTNRAAGTNSFFTDLAFDFGASRVRVGEFRYLLSADGASQPVTIYGSNSLPAWTLPNVQNNANWTAIGSVSAATNNASVSQWVPVAISNTTFWRYLRWSSGSLVATEFELYNSTILSPSQNLV